MQAVERYDTIRDVRSKADMSQLNLPHGLSLANPLGQRGRHFAVFRRYFVSLENF